MLLPFYHQMYFLHAIPTERRMLVATDRLAEGANPPCSASVSGQTGDALPVELKSSSFHASNSSLFTYFLANSRLQFPIDVSPVYLL